MLALQITELKSFMNTLLKTNTLDDFLLQETTLQTAISYVIDGRINQNFFQPEERPLESPEFITYGEVRPTLFELIKGKRTPLAFQLVLQLSPEKSALLFPEGLATHLIKGLILNIRYDGTKAILTSGISYTSFSLDKTPEIIWDEALMHMLSQANISYEVL